MYICLHTPPKSFNSLISLFRSYVLFHLNIKPTSKATFSKSLAGKESVIVLYKYIYIQIILIILIMKIKTMVCELWKICHVLKPNSYITSIHHGETAVWGCSPLNLQNSVGHFCLASHAIFVKHWSLIFFSHSSKLFPFLGHTF